MKKAFNYYRDTPVGQQLGVYFQDRATLRRTIPLFPFSLRELFGRCRSGKAAAVKESADDTPHHAAHAA